MAKKDYELLAKCLKRNLDRHKEDTGKKETLVELAHDLSIFLAGDNYRFNKNTFLKACGLEG